MRNAILGNLLNSTVGTLLFVNSVPMADSLFNLFYIQISKFITVLKIICNFFSVF